VFSVDRWKLKLVWNYGSYIYICREENNELLLVVQIFASSASKLVQHFSQYSVNQWLRVNSATVPLTNTQKNKKQADGYIELHACCWYVSFSLEVSQLVSLNSIRWRILCCWACLFCLSLKYLYLIGCFVSLLSNNKLEHTLVLIVFYCFKL